MVGNKLLQFFNLVISINFVTASNSGYVLKSPQSTILSSDKYLDIYYNYSVLICSNCIFAFKWVVISVKF